MHRVCYFLILLFLLTTENTEVRAGELKEDVLRAVRRACVEVHIGGQLRGGGAFVRDKSGKSFVITAAHLFPNPRVTCFVRTEDDESHFASLSAYDLGSDLALLEVDPSVKRYGTLKVAARMPAETAPLFNFGPALNRRILVLPGSVADARLSYTDFSHSFGYLSHVFVSGINPVLTSGGIWVNRSGEVVGVQHGRLIGDQGAPSSGLSMVSPTSAVAALLASKAVARTPGLGGYVWETWTADKSLLDELPRGIEGLVVNTVFKSRPLARIGIAKFDVIVSCDGNPTRRRHEFLNQIRSKPVGSTFELEIIRPGSQARKTFFLKTDCLEDLWK